jgi:di/tricarboxylate transporter
MVVEPGSPLVGQTIEQAGLRHLPGMYLMEIHRRGRVRPVVGPYERLDGDDQLVFVGLVDSIISLQKTPGLRPATKQLFKLDAPRSDRWFVEAVVSHSCPLIGQSIREGHFRNKYNAVVIAVARNGQRIKKRIGDIILHSGDVLLLEALPAFVEQHRNSNDFYLVSRIENATPPSHEKALPATIIMLVMVTLAATGIASMLQAAAAAAAAMLLTGCVSEETARRKVDWQLLLAIAASFGLGVSLETTGAARVVAEGVLSTAGSDPRMALIAVYGISTLLSALITNNAAAVLVFPIAVATAARLGVSHMPFAIAIMIGASASFATPIGYQTNLMVYGAGGYRFRDFVRIGLPLSILIWAVTVVVTPMVFPF